LDCKVFKDSREHRASKEFVVVMVLKDCKVFKDSKEHKAFKEFKELREFKEFKEYKATVVQQVQLAL
jgi:hypothetical protein